MVVLQELIIGTAAANVSTNFSVTTTLVASDVVVVVTSKGAGSPDTLISGLGATWVEIFDDDANTRAQAHWTTGRTGTGTIAVNVAAPIDPSRVVIYVIRGLASSTLNGLQMSDWDTAGGNDLTPPQVFGQDQFAIGVAISTNPGTATFPTGTPPAAGWTVDDAFTTGGPPLFVAHAIGAPSETTNLNVGITNGGGNNTGAALIILGRKANQPAGPNPGNPVIVEKRFQQFPNVAQTVGLDTVLYASDMVVIAYNHNPVQTMTLPTSNSGGTFYRAIGEQDLNAYGMSVVYLIGATGTTTITLDRGNAGGEVFFWVIRGLNSPTMEIATRTAWGSGSSSGKSTEQVTAKDGQVALLVGMGEGVTTPTFTALSPDTGWSADKTSGGVTRMSSRVITEASTPLNASITSTPSPGPLGMYMFLVGSPNVHDSVNASIVHRLQLAIPSGGSTVTVPLGFTVLASDYVLMILHKGNTGTNFRILGWNEFFATAAVLGQGVTKPLFNFDSTGTDMPDLVIFGRRGLTGTSDIQFDISSTSAGGSAEILVIRGLTEITPNGMSATSIWTATQTADVSTTPMPVVDGMIAIGMGWWPVGQTQFNTGNPAPTPATGWTEELFKSTVEANNQTRFRLLSLEASGSDDMVMTMDNNGTSTYYGALAMTFGEPVTAPSAGTAAFRGWGVPALHVASSGPPPYEPTSSIQEVQTTALNSGTTTTLTLATSLVPSDVVVITYDYFFTGTSSAPTTSGLTFTAAFTAKRLNNPRQSTYWATGGTGVKTITLPSSQGITGGAIALVIRGLNTSTLAGTNSSAYGATGLIASQSLPAGLTVGPGQVLVLVAIEEGSTGIHLPVLTSATPTSGWGAPIQAPAGEIWANFNTTVTRTTPVAATAQFTGTTGYIGLSSLVFGTDISL